MGVTKMERFTTVPYTSEILPLLENDKFRIIRMNMFLRDILCKTKLDYISNEIIRQQLGIRSPMIKCWEGQLIGLFHIYKINSLNDKEHF